MRMFSSSFYATLSLMLFMTFCMYAMSVIHRNYSWVDRSWSIMPVIYTWIHIYYKCRGVSFTTVSADFLPRDSCTTLNNSAVLYGLLVSLWGVRLTFNFARRGGYSRGSEDYRWSYVRKIPALQNPVVWEIYSFSNIAFFQTALLWALALPVMNISTESLKAKDIFLGSIFLLFLIFETICDEQQQRFQRAKRAVQSQTQSSFYNNEQEKYLIYGFCFTGVFGYSRHLNVFCEGCIWVTLAVASLLHGGFVWWQWVGCVVLEMLVTFSTACITEKLSQEKYPLYAIYKQTTPILFPTYRSTTAETLYRLQQHSTKNK